MEQEEEFPDLLLNSLVKLCSDKQQQLFLVRREGRKGRKKKEGKRMITGVILPFQISGIHNSIDKAKRESVELVDEQAEEGENDEEEEGKEVPKLEEARVIKRSNPPLLKLELKKAYEFSHTPGLWSSRSDMEI